MIFADNERPLNHTGREMMIFYKIREETVLLFPFISEFRSSFAFARLTQQRFTARGDSVDTFHISASLLGISDS